MPFDYRNWAVIQPGGTQESLQDGSVIGAPGIYTYQSRDETLLELSAVNYFSPIGNTLFVDDLLYLAASDTVGFYRVLAVDFESGNLIIGAEDAGGDVHGPGSSTDNAVVRWDGATGKLIQNSGVLVDDTNNVSGINDIIVNGIASLLQTNILAGHNVRWYIGGTATDYVGWRPSVGISGTQQYYWPTALPTANNQKFTGDMDGTTSWVDDATGLIWSVVTGASQTVAVGHGYFVNSGVLTTFTTPDTATSTIGDQFEICNLVGTGSSFRIVNPGLFDQMQLASGITNINTGIIDSTSEGDCISFVLRTPATWVAKSVIGNPNLTQ